MAKITWDDEQQKPEQGTGIQWGKKYPIEEESGWKNLPEGPKLDYSTTDPSTGNIVHGTKSFNQFVPASSHIPLSAAPKQQTRPDPLEVPGAFAQGTKEGVAGLLGMPVDLLSAGFNALGMRSEMPIGGSKSINALFNILGAKDYPYKPGLATNIANRIGQLTPNLIAGAAGAARAGAVRAGASPWAAMRQSVAPTLSAGVAGGTAATVAPDKPGVELLSTVLGGGIGAAGQNLAKYWASPNVNSSIRRTINGAVPFNKSDVPKGMDVKQYQQGSVDAVKSIVVANRDTPFKYVEANGVVRTGLPQNRMEFQEAVDQMRARVYKNYNDIQRSAGQKELTFNGDDIVRKLEALKRDPNISPRVRAEAERYINKQAKAYSGQILTPQQIENDIADLGGKIRASAGRGDVTNANVDRKMLEFMREELTNGIDRMTGRGPEYSNFRKQYGNIKLLENRVARGAVKQAAEEGKDKKWWDVSHLTDMGLGAGTLYGATHSPGYAAATAAVLGAKKVHQYLNQADRRIARMFQSAGRNIPPKEQWGPLLTPERPMPQGGGPRQLTQPFVEGEWQQHGIPLPNTPRAGLLESPKAPGVVEAPWKPTHRPGTVASRQMPTMGTVQSRADFDFDAALKSLVDTGMNPVEARDLLIRQLKRKQWGR